MTDSIEVVTIESVEIGQQGPQGIRGEIGPQGAAAFTAVAGEALSATRALRITNDKAYYCDGDNPLHSGTCVGVSLTAALVGELIDVQGFGKISDPTFVFSEGRLFVGTNGVLSSVPGNAFCQEIGIALSETTIFVDLKTTVVKV